MKRNVTAFLVNAAIIVALLWWIAPRTEAGGLFPLDRLNHLDRVEAELAGQIATLEERITALGARVSANEEHLAAVREGLDRRALFIDKIAARIMMFRPEADPNWAYRVAGLIYQHALGQNIDPWLVVSIIKQESNFNSGVRGPCGEIGLMQVYHKNHRRYNTTAKKLGGSDENIRVGTAILSESLRLCNDDLRCGLACYNGGLPPPTKSWAYADRVMATYAEVRK